jgi:hypothetical protein
LEQGFRADLFDACGKYALCWAPDAVLLQWTAVWVVQICGKSGSEQAFCADLFGGMDGRGFVVALAAGW